MSQINIEQRLRELGLQLPPAPKPAGSYVPYVIDKDVLYISGMTPKKEGILTVKGKLGAELTFEEGLQAARLCALNILGVIHAATRDSFEVMRVLKLTGYVASAADFIAQTQVVNGASDLLLEALGEQGKHTRCAVGVSALPGNAPVEIDAIVSIRSKNKVEYFA